MHESLPEPTLPLLGDRAWNIAVTGVGGTGVLTIGALLGMAAHIDGQASMVLDMAGLAQKGGAVLSHVRLARAASMITSPHIVAGSADLLIAADAVVAASRDGIVLCDPQRTAAVVNTTTAPVASFVQHRDIDFKYSAVEAGIAKAVRNRHHFQPFGDSADYKLGDTIATNIMMLGYAWQSGFLPLSFNALDTAIALNGVAVEANRLAFHWGRKLGLDAGEFSNNELQQQGAESVSVPTFEHLKDLVDHRCAHLEQYQNQALADRYRRRVEDFRAHALPFDQDESLARTVAVEYARLLAYKDEYEVARLYALPQFRQQLRNTFAGEYQFKVHLAPPLLSKPGPDGRPRKRAFGSGIIALFRVLQHGKRLRGTPLDVFGYTAERARERDWIKRYEQDMNTVQSRLNQTNLGASLALLQVPSRIRGFGVVKHDAMTSADEARLAALDNLHLADSVERQHAA